MQRIFALLFILLTLFILPNFSKAESVLEEFNEDENVDTPVRDEAAPKLVTEKIQNISGSKKIFILTNENQSFSNGDFITLLMANKLVARALVAKNTTDKMAGIKIVKIYNTDLWKQLTIGKDILVLKGDDSFYTNKEKAPEKVAQDKKPGKKKDNKLQTEEDLYNSTNLEEDDLSVDENSKRLIRPDNLLSFNVGLVQGLDVDGATKRYTNLGVSWAYQITDNIWAEACGGMNTVRDYPVTGLDTQLINIVLRMKYTFNAPFYSYFQPYVGYQTMLANSPGAGVDPGDGSRTQTQLQAELDMVNQQKKSSPVIGVTYLKRIVPGWFARADLGTDIINGGLSIEF